MAPRFSKQLRIAETFLPLIHDDIIIYNILVRLPVKLVGRLRCVSRSWHSLLSNPNFAKHHLNFRVHHHEPEGSILFYPSHTNTLFTINLANESCIVSGILTIPSSCDGEREHSDLAGSCHGLVLVYHHSYNDAKFANLQLLNPITLETLNIPNSVCGSFGLGYDSLHDDYKIVLISRQKQHNTMSIYSVKMKEWMSRGNHVHYEPFGLNGWFVNGCIHWLAFDSDGNHVLAALSVVEEKFEEVPLPKGFNEISLFNFTVILLGGCLALRVPHWDNIDYWVMKDYGVEDSWTKFTVTIPGNDVFHVTEVGALGEDEVLFIKNSDDDDDGEKELVPYSRRDGVWGNIIDTELLSMMIQGRMNFIESLISPKNLKNSPCA